MKLNLFSMPPLIKPLMLSLVAMLFSFNASAELQTVSYVDPGQYLGTWYQIARNPLPFEDGCVCSRQVLGSTQDGRVSVYNSCNNGNVQGPLREIRGFATNVDPTTNAKFIVDFGLPKTGDYWIIGLDPNYRYAVVSDPSMRSLYILSKTPTLAPDLYTAALAEAAKQVDTSRLLITEQLACNYPPPFRTVAKSAAEALVEPPTDPAHPGSKVYSRSVIRKDLRCAGRSVNVFLPSSTDSSEKFPAVVYGHGQALELDSYVATLEHLAKKGVAAIFPAYDNGFFDQDWMRMGRDYVSLTDCAIKETGGVIARDRIVFSGHSKGAYVASIAAGLATRDSLSVRPSSVMLFQTAGFDNQTAGHVPEGTAVTIVFGDKDKVVEDDFSLSYYDRVKSRVKQIIFVKSYPSAGSGRAQEADHFWPVTKGSIFGGGPEGPLHYFGSWKWLTAAALGIEPYLYGPEALDKGVSGLKDEVKKSWSAP